MRTKSEIIILTEEDLIGIDKNYQHNVYYEIDENEDCSLLYNDVLQTPIVIYDGKGKKQIFLYHVSNGVIADVQKSIKNDLQNNLYKIILHGRSTVNVELFKSNTAHHLTYFHELMKQDINLCTNEIQPRKEDKFQNIQEALKYNENANEVTVGNKKVYPQTSTPFKEYLPKYNVPLQRIVIKLEGENIKKNTLKYINLQLLKCDSKEIIAQVKSELSTSMDYKYDAKYGYKFGIIYDEASLQSFDRKEIVCVWGDKLDYNSSIYYIEWILSESQIQEIARIQSEAESVNDNFKGFYLRFRYANKVTDNNKPIWNGWANWSDGNYFNIKINTPPSEPSINSFTQYKTNTN